MNKKHGFLRLVYICFLLAFIVTFNVPSSSAAVPQTIGFYDTLYIYLNTNDCRNCHGINTSDLHHETYLAYADCSYCHSNATGELEVYRDCKTCHFSSTRGHHSSAHALNGQCAVCHLPGLVSSLSTPGNYNPPSPVEPATCRKCHVGDATANPPIAETRDTHHQVGMNCGTCHNADLSMSIKLCEQCHQPNTLHSIHAGGCEGCHSAGKVTDLPPAVVPPSILSFSTGSGYPGSELIISGTHFGVSKGTVRIGVVSATVITWNDQSIRISVPNLTSGNYSVVVINNNGVSNAKYYTIKKPLNTTKTFNYGMEDKLYVDRTEDDCRQCHGVNTADLHHFTQATECSQCHQVSNGLVTVVRDCKVCHTVSPHHDYGPATAGLCTVCHSKQVISDFRSVPKPLTAPDITIPTPSSCNNCHTTPTNRQLHHDMGFYLECWWCHDRNEPYPIRTCENCHSIGVLHNIPSHFRPEQCAGCHTVPPERFPAISKGIPEIISMSKTSGAPGAIFTITGSNFGTDFGECGVFFGQHRALITSWSPTQLTVQVPSLPYETYYVTVTNALGKSNGRLFTITSGSLTGKVTDASGKPLHKALVEVNDNSAYTDAYGYYRVKGLSVGTYAAKVSLSGYTTVTQAVQIVAEAETKADFVLKASNQDTQSPSAPTNLTAKAVSSSQVDLTWTASTDNVGVAGYELWRNNEKIATITATKYSDKTVQASTTYTYYVVAYDAAGNRSAASNKVTVTTPSGTPSGRLTLKPVEAEYGEKIDADVSADRNIKSLNPSVLTRITDERDSAGGHHDVTVREKGKDDRWIYVKVNHDAKDYSSVKLLVRAAWKDSVSTGDFWIYPYRENGIEINTSARVTYNINRPSSGSNFTDYVIDVTNAAHQMDSYGWIKFRIKPGSHSKDRDVRISEVRVILDYSSSDNSSPPDDSPDEIKPPDQVAGTSTLKPTEAEYGERIDADVSADRNIKTLNPSVLTRITDERDSAGGSNDVTVREKGSDDRWIYVKVNQDVKHYRSVKLLVRAAWKDNVSTGDFWIYPYRENGVEINTASRVTYNINRPSSGSNFTDYVIDVTSAAHQMDGYGWMKFRVKPGSYSRDRDVRISEVRFILET